MTLQQRSTNKKQLVIIFSVIAFGTITLSLVSATTGYSLSQNAKTDSLTLRTGQASISSAVMEDKTLPNIPFHLAINGNDEPITISIKRGETIHLDLTIDQKTTGSIGNLKIYDSSMPECGIDNPPLHCTDQPLLASLSKRSVSGNDNLLINLTAPKDLKPGIYSYSVSIDAKIPTSEKQEIINTGYVTAIVVEVI